MKILASELLNRALQIADMVNTDYLSLDEQVALLNEKYRDLYQKAIDNGDLYFVKAVVAVDQMILPEDFYALYSVETQDGVQLDRKAKSETNNTSDKYEIVNNQLYIYNSYSNLKLVYYPKPQEIFVRGNKDAVSVLFTEEVTDGFYENIVVKTENTATVKNVLTGNEIKTVALEVDSEEIYTGNVILAYWKDNDLYVKDTRGNNESASDKLTVYTTGYPVRNGREIQVYDFFNRKLIDVKTGDETDLFLNLPIAGSKATMIYFNSFYYLFSTAGIYRVSEQDPELIDVTEWDGASLPVEYNGSLFYRDIFGNIVKDFEVMTDTQQTASLACVVNLNDAYAYNQAGAVVEPIGILDTELDYPYNVFWDYLSYNMAFYYKNKAGQYIDGVGFLLEQAEKQMFASLSNDDNSFLRIKNKYTVNRW